MIAEHYAAVKTLIESAPALAGKVFPAARTNPDGGLVRDTYVILFPSAPELDDDRLTAVQSALSTATFEFDVRAVAPTAVGVLNVLDHLIPQIAGAIITVDGRRCDPARVASPDPVTPDDSTSPPMYYADVELTVVSRRA